MWTAPASRYSLGLSGADWDLAWIVSALVKYLDGPAKPEVAKREAAFV
jgi:hypothetical protein